MEVSDLLAAESVIADLRVTSKKQALQELSKFAADLTGQAERAIFDVLLERERLGTTGVGDGLATYLGIRLLAAPAALVNMVILGWLLGVQDARSPLYLLLLGNGLNMALDLLFVLELGFEVAGVAWATVIAEYVTLLAGAWFVRRRFGPLLPDLSFRALLNGAAVRRLLVVNGDIVLRSRERLLSCRDGRLRCGVETDLGGRLDRAIQNGLSFRFGLLGGRQCRLRVIQLRLRRESVGFGIVKRLLCGGQILPGCRSVCLGRRDGGDGVGCRLMGQVRC